MSRFYPIHFSCLWSAILLGSLFLTGCGDSTGTLNKTALENIDKGNLDQAEKLLKQALIINPVDRVLIGNLTEVYFRQKKWGEAVQILKKVESYEPLANDRALKVRQAEALVMNKDQVQASVLLKDLVQEEPENEYLLFLQGISSPDPEEAIVVLTKALQIKPDRKESYLALARAQSQQGDNQAARQTLTQCAQKLGSSNDILLYEVGLYLRDNDTEMARKTLDSAPEDIRTLPTTKLFQAYLDLGDRKVDEARNTFESLIDSKETGLRARLGAALCLLIRDDYNQAIEYCQEVTQQNPNDALAYSLMGLGQIKRLQTFMAKQSLEKSLKINPDQPAIRALLDRLGAR